LAAAVWLVAYRPRWWLVGVVILVAIGVTVGVLAPGVGLRRLR
jgi:hypothetical protein